ncbi:LacI family DNA-binding transcriptional regulator [Aquamicrobium zhengzhouense]|uniref:LacI family DNA-binding transcriptional regulator n=1 Tax=Aquamicrobium zhengzhouense TaxID=2781738 RepID=A0ABS0S9B5_9HYPH|nr:LacI family DNA-binding transcriptional regulator [Aquamicrobium zhengzhouense]MBI1619874.1 LacI family DNA-binding transcriptional regulator [Aquamicrobium zhengzhouense]
MKRVTLVDVAQHAGVSRATASLVVRGSPLVSASTRKAVEDAIAELGYVYNLGAARMRAARSHTVGVIIPNLTNPFFAVLLAGIETVLEEAGFAVILGNSYDSPAKQDLFVGRAREHGVDGLIVCPAAGTEKRFIEDALKWGIPLVQTLRTVPDTSTDYSGMDQHDGMHEAVNCLYDFGHRRIGYVASTLFHSAHKERLAKFREAMSAKGIEPLFVRHLESTHQAARMAAPEIMGKRTRPTALICHNDVLALGLHRGLCDLGVLPGRDVSLIGFDNVAEADLVIPGLASVATEPFNVGKNAAELFLRRISAPEAVHSSRVEPTYFVQRGSCGPVRDFAEA